MLVQSTSLTVMILLHLAAKWGYTQPTDLEHDDYYRDICEIQDPFKSPYIRAFYEQPLTIMSSDDCDVVVDSEEDLSSHTTSLPSQEVHVIKVMGSEESNRHGLRIKFRIKSQETAGILQKKLIFVLVSNVSIKWKIHLERIRHSTELHFWLPKGSEIMPDDRLNINEHQLSLSSTTSTEPLLDWVSQTLGPITTMMEVKPNRSLVHTVGIVDTGLKCPDTHPVITAMNISGCLATSSKGRKNKDVHIIELHENMVSYDTQTTTSTSTTATGTVTGTATATATTSVRPVVIEIHPRSISKPFLRKNLLLVLKSHQPTKWVVRSSGLRGTLNIITDRAVDKKRIRMPTTGVVSEQLSSLSGMDLIHWTSEMYGEPISYTNAQMANKFDMTVDGQDEESVEVGQTQHVSCNQKHMAVSLSKRFQINKFATTQLSLADPSCRAQENRTHYYWTVSLTACGTVQQILPTDQITFKNAIIIRVLKTANGQLFDQSGSGLEPPLDHTLVDDENLNLDLPGIVRLDFQCTYPYEHKGPGVHYHLKLYRDAHFQQEMLRFPTTVDDKQKLYVEASIKHDPGVQVMIQNCTLTSPNSEQPGHYLIRNGCPYEKRVRWIDYAGSLGHSRRFEFAFERFWTGGGFTVLQCRLSVCARSSRDALIQQCPPRERDCLLSDPDGSSGSSILSRSVSVGPLILQSPLSGNGLSVQGTSTQVALVQKNTLEEYVLSGGCAQVVHTEGLDPLTVVGIAFAAFTIGVLLTGALWFIHSHTGPIKKHAKGLRSAETSGESTPSSTAPMAIRPSHTHHNV